MELQLIFTVLVFTTVGIALWFGGYPERSTAIALLVAAALTPLAQTSFFSEPEYGILAVDVMLLFWLANIAFTSDRFWPMFATGFHLIGILIHVARIAEADIPPAVYGFSQIFWSYPVMISLLVGTLVEARRAKLLQAHEARDQTKSPMDPS